MMIEELRGLEPVINILYHSLELLKLRLTKIMQYDVETSELKARWMMELKSLTQIAYIGNPDILDSINSTVFAYKNCYTGPQYLLSCFLPISFPLSKKDYR